MGKYLKTDGLIELDIHLRGKLVTLNNEIMITIDTPKQQQGQQQGVSVPASSSSSRTRPGRHINDTASVRSGKSKGYLDESAHGYTKEKINKNMKKLLRCTGAVQLTAKLNLLEIIEDSVSLDYAMRYVLNMLHGDGDGDGDD